MITRFWLEMENKLTEGRISTLLWNNLQRLYPNNCLAKNWKGWSYRLEQKTDRSFFYREFDIARFNRIRHSQHSIEIQLYGYEIKGCRKHRKEVRAPSFAEGVDQVLTLLHQGADFGYLVVPEPEEDEYKQDLKVFCDRFARHVGLLFVTEHGSFCEYRRPERNHHATTNRKKKMLTSLITSGQASKRRIPVWCRRHEF